MCTECDKCVPVTTACGDIRLRVEEHPAVWRLATNILNKQSRTAERGWSSSSLGADWLCPLLLPSAARWKPISAETSRESCGTEGNDEGDRVGALECGGFDWRKGAGN